MTSKIIELKEAYDPDPKSDGDATVGKSSGEYTNRFTEKIRIDKGDSLRIKSVFINDATGPDGNIILQDDLPVTISVGYYVRDWGSYDFQEVYADGRTYEERAGVPAPGGGLTDPRTNKHYVFCRPYTHVGTEKSVSAIRIVWRRSMVFGGDWLGQNAKITISYTHADGKTKKINFTITKRKVQDLLKFDTQKKLNFIELSSGTNSLLKKGNIPFPLLTANEPNFQDLTDGALGNEGVYDFTATTIPNGTENFVTHTKDITFTIPKNRQGYSPAEFGQVVTDKITQLSDDPDTHTMTGSHDSNLMTTTLAEETAAAGGIFLDSDALRLYTTNVTGNPERNTFFGTNQFPVVYRDDLGGKFEIQSMHLPLYSGGQEGVLLLSNGSKNYIANKHSGVFITDVSPPDFFSKFLKIDESDIISCERGSLNNITIGARPLGTIYPTFSFEEGKNATGQLVALDTIVNKEEFAFEKPSGFISMTSTFVPDPANPGVTQPNFETRGDGTNRGVSASFIAEQQHTTILGSNSVAAELQDPYYQIEIDLPIRADFNSSGSHNKKIQGIVGRYYNTNGYTQATEGEGSLSYIHDSDEPLYISELNVRILDSKGELASNIKPDNTVFLEILKENPNQI